MSEERGKPCRERPFGWYEKSVRRLIRKSFDADAQISSTLGIYDALTEIASDEQDNTFTTTHAYIGKMSGYSSATVKRRLTDLENLKVLEVGRNTSKGMRSPSTYSLLTLGHDELSIAHS